MDTPALLDTASWIAAAAKPCRQSDLVYRHGAICLPTYQKPVLDKASNVCTDVWGLMAYEETYGNINITLHCPSMMAALPSPAATMSLPPDIIHLREES
jgi:hypothetical protein